VTKVFLEGLPGAGKTTTSRILREEKIPVARDFGLANGADDYPGNGTTVDEILAIDDWFIQKESERMRSDSGIFDRSYLGNPTYAYAYGRHMGLNSLKPTIRRYARALAVGRLALPEGFVYIDIDPELSIERQHQRVGEGVPLLDDFWRDKFFLQDVRDSHTALFNACTNIPMLILGGETESVDVAHGIASFYRSLELNAPALEPQLQLEQYIADLDRLHDL
jgi:thymidylate kinase